MILDTTVLVDLQRELGRDEPGPATRLLERLADQPVRIGFVTWMKFAEGFADDARDDCDQFLGAFEVLWPDTEASWRASRVSRQLQAEGRRIGDHDAWIAALALEHRQPVATRNVDHFRRVPGLEVTEY